MQLTELAGSAVAVYPAFRRVLGLSASAAQFLSQAVYWTERTGDGWFYKTETEWKEEIGLSSKEVRTARKNLAGMQLLEEVRKGVCVFHATWTLIPRSFGQSFHAHLDRQSERSDAGSYC
ncbi:MAG: hypothetical protein GAK36_00076 [Pseudomonas sp.]|nr:MAG: hypothetical protein GAK36_00076 [Pseudomonas sp.]